MVGSTKLLLVRGNDLAVFSMSPRKTCRSSHDDIRISASYRISISAGTRLFSSEPSVPLRGAIRFPSLSHSGPSSPARTTIKRVCRAFGTTSKSWKIEASSVSMRRSAQPEPDELNFMERLIKAWDVLFPAKPKALTVRQIAKERLQVILASDRCAVPPETQMKIVHNIVEVLSDFLEIEAHEKVQLDVTADRELGTVYSVMVPVKRIRLDREDLHWYESIEEVTHRHLEMDGRLLPGELHVDPSRFFDTPSSNQSSPLGEPTADVA